MQKTKSLVPKKRLLTACLLLFSLFFIHQSCTKIDTASLDKQSIDLTDQFFNLPANADPMLVKIAAKMRAWDQSRHFIQSFAAKEGLPQWKHATFGKATAPANFTGSPNPGDTLVFLPLVVNNSSVVSGFLSCSVNDTNIAVTLFRGADYRTFGYHNIPDSISALSVAVKIMAMDKDVFGYEYFQITDTNLLRYNNKPVTFCLLGAQTSGTSGNNLWVEQGWTCQQVMIPANGGQMVGCPPNVDCPQYVEATVCTPFIIWGVETPGQGGSTPGTGGISPSGGSGPGGGGGIGWNPSTIVQNPCDPTIVNLKYDTAFTTKCKSLARSQVINANYETGFVVNNMANNDFSPLVYGPSGTQPEIVWNFPIGSKRDAKVHVHYAGTINVPSMKDLLDLANTYIFSFARDSTTYFELVINNYSTPYIMKVKNIVKFKNWIYDMQQLNEDQLDEWISSNTLERINYPNNPGKNERGFLGVLKKYRLQDVVSLYKSDNNDCTNWSLLSLTPDPSGDDGYSVIEIPCPDTF